MKINQYKSLSKPRQRKLLLNRGVLIACRQEDTHLYLLYQMDGFYIEILKNKKASGLPSLKCFDAMEPLDPYLELMDLHDYYDGWQ